jgi:hypothetical protein
MRGYLSLLGGGTVVYRRAILEERIAATDLAVLRAGGLVRRAPAATVWPCEREGSCQRDVCASPRGAKTSAPFYAVCEDSGAEDPCVTIDLTAEDVAQESLAVVDLVRLLRELYRIESAAHVPGAIGAEPFLLGEERSPEGARDVFLALDGAKVALPSFLAVRERVERPTLVLVPTAHGLSPELAARHAPGGHVEIERLDDALAVRGEKIARVAKLRLVARAPLALAEPVGKTKKKRAPRPPGRIAEEIGATGWNEIKITVVDGHTVRIQHGKITIRRNYNDLGLGSAGRRDPTEKWKLLLLVCAGHGSFRWKTLGSYKAAKNAVYVLRVALKESFGLADDPFHRFHAVNGWKAKFFASSEIAEED